MAPRVSFTIRMLTACYEQVVGSENHFVDVSTVLLHKMYYNISKVCPESLKTQKNQKFLRGFLINFVFFL